MILFIPVADFVGTINTHKIFQMGKFYFIIKITKLTMHRVGQAAVAGGSLGGIKAI